MSLKIALYHNLPSGGARRAMVEITKGLASQGHTIDEYCLETADLSLCVPEPSIRQRTIFPFRPNGVCEKRIPLLSPYITLGRLVNDLYHLVKINRTIAHTIDDRDYDIVLSHDCLLGQNPPILYFLNTPSIHYCHHGASSHLSPIHQKPRNLKFLVKHFYYALPRNLYPSLIFRQAKRSIQSATRVITNSYFSVEALYRVYNIQSHVCYLGVNNKLFRPLGLERERFILSVGAVHYYKGYRFLIKTLGLMSKSMRPTLVIAANSVEPNEEQMIKTLAHQYNVTLSIIQVNDDQELVRLYNRATAFVYTPIMEPWGLTAVEAMACGTPVVAVAEGGVRESIVDNETGYLIERDEQTFADILSKVIADKTLVNRLGTEGVNRVTKQFTWEKTINRIEQIIHKTTT